MNTKVLQRNRRISTVLTEYMLKTSLTPNQVTCMALLFGLGAGVSMSFGSRIALIFGAFLLHISFILDNCDGELARAKNLASKRGQLIDMVSDLFVDFSLWTGLYLGSLKIGLGGNHIHSYLLVALVGSLFNFLIVMWERKKGCSDSIHVDSPIKEKRKGSLFFGILEFLSRNGDVVFLVWIIAFFGRPDIFLIIGAFYMNFLWLTRFAANSKYLI